MYFSSICEYRAEGLSHELEKYNRTLGIEIRGPGEVSELNKKKLDSYTNILYRDLPPYTEDINIIEFLSSISMRELVPIRTSYPIQMIVFCPLCSIEKILTENKWIKNTLSISSRSLYTFEFSDKLYSSLFPGKKKNTTANYS